MRKFSSSISTVYIWPISSPRYLSPRSSSTEVVLQISRNKSLEATCDIDALSLCTSAMTACAMFKTVLQNFAPRRRFTDELRRPDKRESQHIDRVSASCSRSIDPLWKSRIHQHFRGCRPATLLPERSCHMLLNTPKMVGNREKPLTRQSPKAKHLQRTAH